MPTFEDIQRRIAELPDATFQVFHAATRPATEDELRALETRVGRPIAPGLRELLLRWGALVVEVRPEVWPRPVAHEVLPLWRFQYGFGVLGVGATLPPELTIDDAYGTDLAAHRAVPFLRRRGGRFLAVSTADGVASWDAGKLEAIAFDELELILEEIRALEEGVARLRTETASAAALVATAREHAWKGPRAAHAIEALQKASPDELRPHVRELATELLRPDSSFSIGCLDILAVAGRDAFAEVAELVYAHTSTQQYVFDLLGAMEDVSPRALELYEAALDDEDDDVAEHAIAAIQKVAKTPAARPLISAIERRVDAGAGEHRFALIATLGHAGSPRFAPAVAAALEGGVAGAAFATLVGKLAPFTAELAPLAPQLLAGYRTLVPTDRSTLSAIETLVKLGVVDREAMEPTVRAFHARGGNWAVRADRVLHELARF